jgi:hypothetical protein
MSKQDYTHLTLILDTSGSMGNTIDSVRKSATQLLEAQDKLGMPLTITLGILPSRHGYSERSWGALHNFISVENAIRIISNLRASGGTPLSDAIGNTANSVASHIFDMADADQPEKVIFAIVTDGQNGYSSLHNLSDVKRIVDHNESTYGWEFLYVGSNQNAYGTGKKMGIKAGKALSYASTVDGVENAMNAIGGAITRFRQNGAPHANQFFGTSDHNYQASLGASASPASA